MNIILPVQPMWKHKQHRKYPFFVITFTDVNSWKITTTHHSIELQRETCHEACNSIYSPSQKIQWNFFYQWRSVSHGFIRSKTNLFLINRKKYRKSVFKPFFIQLSFICSFFELKYIQIFSYMNKIYLYFYSFFYPIVNLLYVTPHFIGKMFLICLNRIAIIRKVNIYVQYTEDMVDSVVVCWDVFASTMGVAVAVVVVVIRLHSITDNNNIHP